MRKNYQHYLSSLLDLLQTLEGLEVSHSQCGPELFRISCKIHSPYTLLVMHHFASVANFRFRSWSIANPYTEDYKTKPTTAIVYCIEIASQEPNRHQALFTLKILGQLLVQHQFKTGQINETESKQAIKMWLHEDDEG
ncbi:MAG: hypothetical protein KDI92_02855 [Xanthomonadales bacterium]|nr:hypothetical protein [Xanthomonadales bacterium]